MHEKEYLLSNQFKKKRKQNSNEKLTKQKIEKKNT